MQSALDELAEWSFSCTIVCILNDYCTFAWSNLRVVCHVWMYKINVCLSFLFLFSLQKHKVDLFYKLRHVMNELIDLRRQLLSGHLTQDQVREVKRHITVRLDWGNEWVTLFYLPENAGTNSNEKLVFKVLLAMLAIIKTSTIDLNIVEEPAKTPLRCC